jgi:hypothetical protein
MELCITPRDETAIVPDEAVTIIERDHGHRIFLAPSNGWPANGRPVRRQHGRHMCRLEPYIPKDA